MLRALEGLIKGYRGNKEIGQMSWGQHVLSREKKNGAGLSECNDQVSQLRKQQEA